jgi:hypothetical protein
LFKSRRATASKTRHRVGAFISYKRTATITIHVCVLLLLYIKNSESGGQMFGREIMLNAGKNK